MVIAQHREVLELFCIVPGTEDRKLVGSWLVQPNLVVRKTTEQAEASEAHVVGLVETDRDCIVHAVMALLDDLVAHEQMA